MNDIVSCEIERYKTMNRNSNTFESKEDKEMGYHRFIENLFFEQIKSISISMSQ